MKKKEVVRELNDIIIALDSGTVSLSLNNWVIGRLEDLIDDIEER